MAVLNFANNHSIGGAPFSAGAQEESLCRCSTLYPCLQAMREPFYQKHKRQFDAHEIGYMGNDDLIYTPDVVARVFRTLLQDYHFEIVEFAMATRGSLSDIAFVKALGTNV